MCHPRNDRGRVGNRRRPRAPTGELRQPACNHNVPDGDLLLEVLQGHQTTHCFSINTRHRGMGRAVPRVRALASSNHQTALVDRCNYLNKFAVSNGIELGKPWQACRGGSPNWCSVRRSCPSLPLALFSPRDKYKCMNWYESDWPLRPCRAL